MPDSKHAIMKVNHITLTPNYQELVKYVPRKQWRGYIREIKVSLELATGANYRDAQIKVEIKPCHDQVKDESLTVATTTLPYGGNLVFEGGADEGITVYIKNTGAYDIYATGIITGIEEQDFSLK